MILEALMPRAATPGPTDDFWYTDYPVHAGGADVSPNGALQVTAVMACVRVLAETIAQLPLHLMATDGRMRRRAIDQPLYDVLHDQPNDWQTSFEFREMMQGHLALRGNAYAQIVPGPRGAVDQLIPLHPDRMQVFRLENGRIGYLYRDQKGIPYRLTQDEVFHLRFMSFQCPRAFISRTKTTRNAWGNRGGMPIPARICLPLPSWKRGPHGNNSVYRTKTPSGWRANASPSPRLR